MKQSTTKEVKVRQWKRIIGVWGSALIFVLGLSINVDAAECQTVTFDGGYITGHSGNTETVRTGLVGRYLWVQVGEYTGQMPEEGTISHEVPAGATSAVVCDDGSVTFNFEDVLLTQTTEICPALDSDKIDTTGDPATVTVTAPAGFLIDEYCVKAGTTAVFVTVDPPASSVVIDHPDKDSVSHYSVSYVPVTTTTQPEVTTSSTTTTPSTTTTLPSSTTTTAPPSTTTTPASTSTTTGGSSTTTSTLPAPTTSAPTDPTTTPTEPPEELPFTGSDAGLVALIAGLLGLSGVGLVAWKGRSE